MFIAPMRYTRNKEAEMDKKSSVIKSKPWRHLTFEWNDGQGLSDARFARNMTQEKLAELSGVFRTSIVQYEMDPSKDRHQTPRPETLEWLEGALEVTFTNVVRGATHEGTVQPQPTKETNYDRP
jgi:DNA-binding XRE family transcriptional regulator